MSYKDELIWAIHPSMKKPARMTRGAFDKVARLGWQEYKGEYDEQKEKETVFKEEDSQENQQKQEYSDDYKRLISEGIIRHID